MSLLIAHSAQRMFDLVEDIEAYPDFLPWCARTEVNRITVSYQGGTEAVRDSVRRYNDAESAVWNRMTPKKSRVIETKD